MVFSNLRLFLMGTNYEGSEWLFHASNISMVKNEKSCRDNVPIVLVNKLGKNTAWES